MFMFYVTNKQLRIPAVVLNIELYISIEHYFFVYLITGINMYIFKKKQRNLYLSIDRLKIISFWLLAVIEKIIKINHNKRRKFPFFQNVP